MKKVNLLSPGATNAKTAKNSLKTFILYLIPHTQNSKGVNLCPGASTGCIFGCLVSAGRGAFSNVHQARLKKTEYFISDKRAFINDLSFQILKEYNKAKKGGYQIAFRLNGTSDLDFIYMLNKYAMLDISTLADFAKFYDYTKLPTKALRYKDHPNYTVTFSRSETNHKECLELLAQGVNVAVVFNGEFPASFGGAPVVDGDASDLVMLYNKGVCLGLKAKGKAKKDTSGFVINTNLPF